MTSTMSWFDTAGLASFAKSALKEAQKTLDKALDIQEEDIKRDDTNIDNEESDAKRNEINSGSVWGSFTGSYFDTKKMERGTTSEPNTPMVKEGRAGDTAPLATPEQELTPVDSITGFPSKFTTADEVAKGQPVVAKGDGATNVSDDPVEERVRIRPKTRRNSANRTSLMSINRLSAISMGSNESERKSSESVDVLGSQTQSAATSPDSILLSTSSSIGLAASSSCTNSVEVIDSLASPSSIEVISDCGDAGDSAVTPGAQSPGYSTGSVEVIEDIEEGEEEESYASLSESTGTTMMSHLLRSGASTPDVLKLSMPSHGSCDLLCESIQEVDWESPESSQHESNKSVHNSPIRRILSKPDEKLNKLEKNRSDSSSQNRLTKLPSIEDESKYDNCGEGAPPPPPAGENEDDADADSGKPTTCAAAMDSSQSDSDCRTAVDSSCEGTLMGSSSEDCTVVHEASESPERGSKVDGSGSSASSSVYMKELLAEAMKDDASTRDTSPTLSDNSKSDLVKVGGSDQTSGHTSADEVETTASSDIEIISRSSPTCDSSSTTSRHSPAKLGRHKLSLMSDGGRSSQKTRQTHQRVPSEASSAGSEDCSSEADRLSRKIMEMTEVLEAREAKLVELSRSSLELQERNLVLKKQLETASKPQETACEKDDLIRELREEGEKLSLTQLKQSNIIKTLRKQEQSQQIVIVNYKKQVENLTKELESMKDRVASKEEWERSQLDQMKLMTGKVVRQDKEIAALMDQLEQAVIKAEQLRINLDSAEHEIEKKTVAVTSLEKELVEVRQRAESAKRDRVLIMERDSERAALIGQLDELREQIKQAQINHQRKESILRDEKKNLLRRLEEADGRNEELTQSVSLATRPLIKQLEQLQNTLNQQRDAFELRERQLQDQLEAALMQENAGREMEKAAKTEVSNLRNRVAAMEDQLRKAQADAVKAQVTQHDLHSQLASLEEELIRVTQERDKDRAALLDELAVMRQKVSGAEQSAAAANARADAAPAAMSAVEIDRGSSPPPSPTLSFGKLSMSGSEWQIGEDAFDTSSVTGRNLYDSMRGGSTTVMESLQAQLKMREGEALQLQWEVQRRDAERAALTAELTSLTASLADREEAIASTRHLQQTLAELQRNYDALLQIHGEKVEEVEELRLDLQDVKEMYKAQVDQLLGRNSECEEAPR